MWSLYDHLIDPIPNDIYIEEALTGPHWTMVRAGSYAGVAMSISMDTITPMYPSGFAGVSLKEAAQAVKSWNLIEASIGMAAINAYYNQPHQVDAFFYDSTTVAELSKEDVFSVHLDQLKGKKVAVVGHFPHLERLKEVATLSILERNPREGDYLDSACEYILPEQDFVFITASTLINKTLPRLLTLSKNAYVIIVGPTTPLSPALFSFGVNELNGLMIQNIDGCRAIVEGGGTGGTLARQGQRMSFCSHHLCSQGNSIR